MKAVIVDLPLFRCLIRGYVTDQGVDMELTYRCGLCINWPLLPSTVFLSLKTIRLCRTVRCPFPFSVVDVASLKGKYEKRERNM